MIFQVAADDGAYISRLFEILHDKRTMKKILQIATLVNHDLGRILDYFLKQGKLW